MSIKINRLSNGGIKINEGSAIRMLSNLGPVEINNNGSSIRIISLNTQQIILTFDASDLSELNGSAAPSVMGDLLQKLNNSVFSGSQAFVAPGKFDQTIEFAAPASIPHTHAPITLDGESSSELPLSYASSDVTKFTISGNVLTPVAAGTANITASQAGDSNYNAATNVVVPFTLT